MEISTEGDSILPVVCSGATKGALDMLTKVMALELGPYQVHSLCRIMDTPLHHLDHCLAH